MHLFIIAPANRPGTLAGVLDGIAQRGINVTAVGAATWGDTGAVAIQVNDDDGARAALQESGANFRESATVTAWLDDQPGSLAAAARSLGDAGVNIEAIVPVGMQEGKVGLLFGVDNEAAAKAALGV